MGNSASPRRSALRSWRWLGWLAFSHWRARPGRSIGALLAITIGVGAVIWVACCYESIRQSVNRWATGYVGKAHVTINSPLGRFDQLPQRIVARLEQLDNVRRVVPQLQQRLRAEPWPASAAGMERRRGGWSDELPEIDFIGILPSEELALRAYPLAPDGGRLLTDDDGPVCVLEAAFARELGLTLGDSLLVWPESSAQPYELKLVGLIERPRIARFQKPIALVRLAVLQDACNKAALITSVDVMLDDASPEKLGATAARVHSAVRRISRNAIIRSAESRVRQVEQAENQQRFVLMMLSSVAMLTALFIILSTLSIGMVERVGQLGLMRCVGLTRSQLAALMLLEVLPLGALGALLGVPLGLGLAALTVQLVPEYVGEFPIRLDALFAAANGGVGVFSAELWSILNQTGIVLAVLAGLLTTLLGALLPILGVLRVSPMEAARPRARQSSASWPVVVALLGAALLTAQHLGIVARVERSMWFLKVAAAGIVLLYVGYAMIGPLLVQWIGRTAVVLVARLLTLRTRLLQVQVGYAVWRSAGICCGLMVGLSLIVGIVVVNHSVTAGWQFPKQFPEAYIWSFEQMRGDAADLVRRVPGVGEFSVANAINVHVEERPVFLEQAMLSVTWFLGCEPDSFLSIGKVEFLQGDEASARRLLKEGGHIIVADDFARSRNKNVGDKVKVIFGNRVREFTVAGVIQSPAIDMAAGYFQAQTEYHVVASGSVIGTNEDLKRLFDVNGVRLVLLNFDLPDEPVPDDWPPAPTGARSDLPEPYYDDAVPLDVRWRRYREAKVLYEIRQRLNATTAFGGTMSELKAEIDRELTRMTNMVTAVPGVAMLVAAIGVINLMTANVAARSRQIAILRAVGATRGLVLRMVVGEAVVLGVLGSAMGLALGVHVAYNITGLMDSMWGLRIALTLPWDFILIAFALTVGLCIVTGLAPARFAARTNFVAAWPVSCGAARDRGIRLMRVFGTLALGCLLLGLWLGWRVIGTSMTDDSRRSATTVTPTAPPPRAASPVSPSTNVASPPTAAPSVAAEGEFPAREPHAAAEPPVQPTPASTAQAALTMPSDEVHWADDVRRRREESDWNKLQAALAREPEHPDILASAIALAQRQHRWNELADLQRRLLALDPADDGLRFEYASTCLRLGLCSTASAQLEGLLSRDPRHVRAWHNLVVALRAQRRLGEALAAADHLLELEPDNVEALASRAELRLDLDQPAEAARDLRAALELKPDDADLRINLALALRELGEIATAHQELERVLAAHPGNLLALNRLAASTWESGSGAPTDAGAAARVVDLCQRSLAIDANQPEVRELLKRASGAVRDP